MSGMTVKIALAGRVPLGAPAAAVSEGAAAAVRQLGESLGLPDAPQVTVSEAGTEPTVVVNGRPHVLGSRRLEEAERAALGSPGGPATDAETVALVAELVLGPLRGRPDRLLTLEMCQRYLEIHGGSGSAIAPATFRQAVAPVLACGISIADGARVLKLLDAALAEGERPETAAEELIAELRAPAVEVLLAPDAFSTVTAAVRNGEGHGWRAATRILRGRRSATASGTVPAAGEPEAIEPFDTETHPAIRNLFEMLNDGLFYELGLHVPDVRLIASPAQPLGTFAVRMHALTGPTYRSLEPGTALVNASAEALDAGGILARNPATGRPAAIVHASTAAALGASGNATWDPLDYVVLAVAADLRGRAGQLVDIHTVEHDLAVLQQAFPELVLATLGRVTLPELTHTIRCLQREGLSVRNLRRILERLLEFDTVPAVTADMIVLDERLVVEESVDLGPAALSLHRAQFVRNGFKDEIAQIHTSGTSSLNVAVVSSTVAQRVLEHTAYEFGQPGGRPLTAEELDVLFKDLRAIWHGETDHERLVLLTNAQTRGLVADLLGDAVPGLFVLAFEELPQHLHLQHIGSLRL